MGIKKFLNNVFSDDKNKHQKYNFGELSKKETEMIKKKTGLHVDGYKRTIDNFDVKHIFKNNGNPKTEAKRGQIAVKKDDIEKIPEITKKPDDVKKAGKNKIGNDMVKYNKEMNENEYFYYEEKRNGKKELAAKTRYKRKQKR